MKKIFAIVIIGGFGLTSCGKSICDAYSHTYKKDNQDTKTSVSIIFQDASAEAQG